MEKYDFIKCMNLHKKLKEKIKGNIFISLDKNSNFLININGPKRLMYRCNIEDMSKNASIDQIAEKIEEDYKNYILEKYFIRR